MKYNNKLKPITEIADKNIKLTPETKINNIQVKQINKVWPKSGWMINKKDIINVKIRVRTNFKVKFFSLWKVSNILKTMIKKGLTSSIGWSLGKKNISSHLFDPLTSTPMMGTKNNNVKDTKKI